MASLNHQEDPSPYDRWHAVIRISSQSTFFYKRVFPAIWFGGLGVFVCIGGVGMVAQQNFGQLPESLIPLFLAIIGYAFMKWFVFCLVDEVWDCGDSLLVKNKGVEYRFEMSDFLNVSYTGAVNPPRVTLSLREPSDLGTKVTFIPLISRVQFAFSMPPIVRDLMLRVDEARRAA